MMTHRLFHLLLSGLALATAPAVPVSAQAVLPANVSDAVARLKPGEYLWAPQLAPTGPLLIVVSLERQRAYVYRNGVMIGVTTVSTGVEGKETPTGVFTILQKHVEHKSNLYDDAPMPFMQRLTWDGIAMHAGKLPGYPASHGCIRLPNAFAKLLFEATSRGTTVVITKDAPIPRVAPTPDLLQRGTVTVPIQAEQPPRWQPELAPEGPVSIIISGADKRLVVLRNGVEIGAAAVTIAGGIPAPAAYVLRNTDASGPHWLSLALPWSPAAGGEEIVAADRARLGLAEPFRRKLLAILVPGTTVVATPDSLSSGGTGAPITVLSDR
ncbi:L,D-transpeptidase [Sphingomonas sp. TDK1]|uniref:L,D-transpeptidase n=1 Tax=Sphingomonas sp. TDK1 TaxID=453247 RepID=UPI000ACAD440|nr:L,D-transpeptidase [Sphingomonas sp. TDK1]